LVKQARSFDDGAIIHQPGQAVEKAYRIVTGNVELEPGRAGAATTLLGPGDMFAEGAPDLDSDGRARSTARAIGPVGVDLVEANALGRAVRKVAQAMAGEKNAAATGIAGGHAGDPAPDPARGAIASAAAQVTSQVTEAVSAATQRGRGATAIKPGTRVTAEVSSEGTGTGSAQALAPATAANGPPRKSRPLISGFFEKLIGRDEADGHDRLEIHIGDIRGDEEGAVAKALATELDRRRGLKVSVDERKLPAEDPEMDEIARVAAENTWIRKRLGRLGGDAMIAGRLSEVTGALHLRIVPARVMDPDYVGAGGDLVVLALPSDADDACMDFLHAVLLAQTLPRAKGKALTRRRDLPVAAEGAFAYIAQAQTLTSRERASLEAAAGRLAGALAGLRPRAEHYQAALAHFETAVSLLDVTDPGFDVERALVEKERALAMQSLAERTNDTAMLEASVEVIRTSLDILDRRHFPWHWAALQHRLGLAVFRLDFDSGDVDTMKQALGAYQAALSVYSRKKTPRKWADIMGHLAQAAQVLGQQVRSPEALAKAAEACRQVLEVRRKSDGPLLWAATQNNLGAALFLLGKMTKRIADLEGAEQAFELALSVYTTRGTERMAYVTEKNLDHVRRLLHRIHPNDPPLTPWEKTESFEIGADLRKPGQDTDLPDYDPEREAWV